MSNLIDQNKNILADFDKDISIYEKELNNLIKQNEEIEKEIQKKENTLFKSNSSNKNKIDYQNLILKKIKIENNIKN